jgi:periplasmic protein TorT
MTRRRRTAVVLVLLLGAFAGLYAWRNRPQRTVSERADHAHAIGVDAFYGKYDASTKDIGLPARSLHGPKRELWKWDIQPLEGRKYRIGVLFPNREQNDPYWRAVRLGVEQQAKQSKIDYELVVTDDYTHVDQHQKQFEELARSGVDAIVIGAIHYRAMDSHVERATSGAYGRKIPVIAVINDIYAPAISAKVLVSFLEMGKIAGDFVFDQAREAENSELTIAFFPGPINSGWAPDSLRGFLSVIRHYPGELRVLTPEWGTPDTPTQSALVEKVLESHNNVDYIVGNAVAAAAAIEILEDSGRQHEVRIVSTYYSEALKEDIASGRIEAAPSDQTEALGRIAIGMAVRILNGEKPGETMPFQVGPSIEVKSRHAGVTTAGGPPKPPRRIPS